MSVKFKIRIVKVGNSLRITIPKEIAEATHLKIGDLVNVSLEDNRIIVCKAKESDKTKKPKE
jgi:AbrB family looped-hinge helix DNA binding protein